MYMICLKKEEEGEVVVIVAAAVVVVQPGHLVNSHPEGRNE